MSGNFVRIAAYWAPGSAGLPSSKCSARRFARATAIAPAVAASETPARCGLELPPQRHDGALVASSPQTGASERPVNVNIVKDKIVMAEDFFEPPAYQRIAAEIEQLRPRIEPTYHGMDVVLYRAVLDEIYPERKKSFILQAMESQLYCQPILDQAARIHDLCYTLLNKQHKYTTTLTEMRGDTDYRTHTDTGDGVGWTQIFMSWIWYYNPRPQAFTGGELIVEDLDLTVTPKDNRFVLLPAYLRHRIVPAVYSEEGYYRTTLNGFLMVAPPAPPPPAKPDKVSPPRWG